MTKAYSTYCIEQLCDFRQTSDIEDITISCPGVRSLRLGLKVSRTAAWADILGAKIEIYGGNSSTSADGFYIPASKIALSATAGVSFTSNSSTLNLADNVQSLDYLVEISDPPSFILIRFSASTFPASAGAAFFSASSSWC